MSDLNDISLDSPEDESLDASIDAAVAKLVDEDQEEKHDDQEQDPNEDDDEPESEEPETAEEESEKDEPTEGEEGDEEEESEDREAEFTLPSGETVTQSDLISGYMKNADYTQKTQKLSASQREYNERIQYTDSVLSQIAEYIGSKMPEMPDPSLAHSNSALYTSQRALHEQAMSEVQSLLALREEVRGNSQEVANQALEEWKAEQEQVLLKAMPHLSDAQKRAQFNNTAIESAKHYGFSDEEIAGPVDGRILQMMYHASIGRKALANRDKAKDPKQRVEAPKKARVKSAKGNPKSNRLRAARENYLKDKSVDSAIALLGDDD